MAHPQAKPNAMRQPKRNHPAALRMSASAIMKCGMRVSAPE